MKEFDFSDDRYGEWKDTWAPPEIRIGGEEPETEEILAHETTDTSSIVAPDDRGSNEASSPILPAEDEAHLNIDNQSEPIQLNTETSDPAASPDLSKLAANGVANAISQPDPPGHTPETDDAVVGSETREDFGQTPAPQTDPEVNKEGEDIGLYASEAAVASTEQHDLSTPIGAEASEPQPADNNPQESFDERATELPDSGEEDRPVIGYEPPLNPPTDQKELQSEEPEDPLPLIVNDIRWGFLHGGSVRVVDNPRPGGEVLKIYQRPSTSSVPAIKLTTPGGTVAFLHGHEIVQVHKRNDEGVVESKPSAAFQGQLLLPKGYDMTFVPENDLSDEDREVVRRQLEELERESGDRLPVDPIVNFQDPLSKEYSESTIHEDYALLSKVSRIFRRNQDSGIRAIPSGEPNVSLVHYPLWGKPMKVITPSGFLLAGYTKDVILLVQENRTGIIPLTELQLSELSKDERFIVL